LTIHRTGNIIIMAPSQDKILKAVEHAYKFVEQFQKPVKKLRKRTKKERLKIGFYRIMIFRRFSQVTSFSIFFNKRGWHCAVCKNPKYVVKTRTKLKIHYLEKHRFEKKLF